jgi:hypothetical protein
LSALGFTRVPHAVTDALQRGDITPLQFQILVMLHKLADWTTGEVKSWSAERFLHEMGPQEGLPEARTVRRAQQRLRAMGWYSHDYVDGPKRPYNVLINNYLIFRPVQANDQDGDPEKTLVRQCKIKTFVEASLGHDHASDRGSDHESLGQVSSKDQYAPPLSAPSLPAPQEGSKARAEKIDGFGEMYARVYSITKWMPDSAPAALKRLLKLFSPEQIEGGVRWARQHEGGGLEAKDVKRLFADGGAQLEIEIRDYLEIIKVKNHERADKQKFSESRTPGDGNNNENSGASRRAPAGESVVKEEALPSVNSL